MELVTPFDDQAGVLTGVLAQRLKMYHIAYLVPDLMQALKSLKEQRAKLVVNPSPAVAFNGRSVAFLVLPEQDVDRNNREIVIGDAKQGWLDLFRGMGNRNAHTRIGRIERLNMINTTAVLNLDQTAESPTGAPALAKKPFSNTCFLQNGCHGGTCCLIAVVWPLKLLQVGVIRNVAFENVAAIMEPFLAHADCKVQWSYSDYDDSLSLTALDTGADVVLVWLDFCPIFFGYNRSM